MALSINSQDRVQLTLTGINSLKKDNTIPVVRLRQPESGSGASDSTELKSVRAQAESRASNAILSGSINLALKEDITEKIAQSVQQIIAKAEELEKEVNPVRKAALEGEVNNLISQAQSNFAAAVASNPSIAEDFSIVAIVKPGAASEDAQKVFSSVIIGAASPNDLGLTGLSFAAEDLTDTLDKLDRIAIAVENRLSNFSSSGTYLSVAVKERGQAANAEDQIANEPTATEKVEQLADKIRSSVNLDTLPVLDQINVETLLNTEEKQNAEGKKEQEQEMQEAKLPNGQNDQQQQNINKVQTVIT